MLEQAPFHSSQLPTFLLGVVMVLILIATQTPFDYTPVHWSLADAQREFFHHPSNLQDLVNNVIMFLPFGFCWVWLSHSRGWKWLTAIWIVGLLSGGFSLLVETLQLFLPPRMSSIIDISTNSLGGILGGLSYWIWPRYYAFLQPGPAQTETHSDH